MTGNEVKTRITRCPTCGRSARYDAQNENRPFCSSRCKTNDIACWAEESYRIPSQSAETDDDDASIQEVDEN